MRMNRNTLMLLLGSLVVIVAALVLINSPALAPANGDDETLVDAERGPLFAAFADLTVDDIAALTVEDDSGRYAFAASEDGWMVTESPSELEGDVDAERLERVIGAFLALETIEQFTAEDLNAYGLDEPTALISLADDDTTYRVYIGSRNPGGNRYYALLDNDESTVHLISTVGGVDQVTALAVNPPVLTPPTPTPEPQLIVPGLIFADLVAGSSTRFEVHDYEADESLILLREEGLWLWGDFDAEAVDQDRINIMLEMLAFIESVDGLPGTDLARFGLDEPRYEIFVTSADRDYRLRIGGDDPSETRLYALVNDFDTVVTVRKDEIEPYLRFLELPPLMPDAEATAEADDSES